MNIDCCKSTKKHKLCKRKSDGKIFSIPRRFTRKRCLKGVKGFTMKSSCAPYKNCKMNKQTGGGEKYKGVSVINMNQIKGVVKFSSRGNKCKIKYKIRGLKNGKHGFHIHRCGDMTKGCISGCEHFNPLGDHHGGPHSKHRHAGDLGNIIAKNGIAKGSVTVNHLSCNPKSDYSIIGRMIIVHEDEDDLGKGDNEESLKTGNAGKRIACSIIGISG